MSLALHCQLAGKAGADGRCNASSPMRIEQGDVWFATRARSPLLERGITPRRKDRPRPSQDGPRAFVAAFGDCLEHSPGCEAVATVSNSALAHDSARASEGPWPAAFRAAPERKDASSSPRPSRT